MSAISGLSGTTKSAIQGYGGLASGLDRDALIEGMMVGTQTKIDKQQQKIDKETWTQSAMRDITSAVYEFTNKYTSFTSSSNLLGNSLFTENMIEAQGEYSKYLSVKGQGSVAENIKILGVKQLAQNASLTTQGGVSTSTLKSAGIATDLSGQGEVGTLAGKYLNVRYGEKTYSVKLEYGEGYDYSTEEKAIESINKSLGEVEVAGGDTLADVMKFTYNSESNTIGVENTTGNFLSIESGTGTILKDLGLEKEGVEYDGEIPNHGTLNAEGELNISNPVSLAESFSGKSMVFSYNGKEATITLGEYDETATLENIRADIQKELDSAYGQNRIVVALEPEDEGKQSLNFTTVRATPDKDGKHPADSTSTIKIIGGDSKLVGANGLLGIDRGESNRLNTKLSLDKAGLASMVGKDMPAEGALMTIKNGDKEVDLTTLDVTWESSVDDIINAINKSDLDIQVGYNEYTDSFTVASKQEGASGSVELSGNIAEMLFGDLSTAKEQEGQDSVIAVQYGDTGEVTELYRSGNTIDMDGVSVTLKNTFGYGEDGKRIADTEAVTFQASMDTEKTADVVEEMVKEFNAILTNVHAQVTEKPNRDYTSLTDAQKDGMTDDEIERWEKEAKKGLLYGDTDMRGFVDALRFTIPLSLKTEFEEIGITVSSDYTENGKIEFDRTKFEAALAEDPEAVGRLMNSESIGGEDGQKGLMVKMKDTMDRYAGMTGATKGILVERAGSIHAATTILDNTMQKMIDDMEDYMDKLLKSFDQEQDRYIADFTALETAIAQMNSQSASLGSMFTAQ